MFGHDFPGFSLSSIVHHRDFGEMVNDVETEAGSSEFQFQLDGNGEITLSLMRTDWASSVRDRTWRVFVTRDASVTLADIGRAYDRLFRSRKPSVGILGYCNVVLPAGLVYGSASKLWCCCHGYSGELHTIKYMFDEIVAPDGIAGPCCITRYRTVLAPGRLENGLGWYRENGWVVHPCGKS